MLKDTTSTRTTNVSQGGIGLKKTWQDWAEIFWNVASNRKKVLYLKLRQKKNGFLGLIFMVY